MAPGVYCRVLHCSLRGGPARGHAVPPPPQIKKGPMKGQLVEVIKRKIPIDRIASVSLRYV